MPTRGTGDSGPHALTLLLRRFGKGDPLAGTEVMRVIEAELRRIASAHLRKERKGHTLQTTALVNEACLRLLGAEGGQWQDRGHFYAVASRIMRQILVDYARSHEAQKRAGRRVDLDTAAVWTEPIQPRILDVDRALGELEELAPRQAKLVELRFFAGLTLEESASVLEMAPRTADKDWALARAWLRLRLTPKPGAGGAAHSL
jgi:RNA polymerase sigma-70 factor (ECF subfamily)